MSRSSDKKTLRSIQRLCDKKRVIELLIKYLLQYSDTVN